MTEHAALSRSEAQALELLPWYVNGTLEGEEREQVRRELRSSLTCRLEYERLCRMRDLMREDDPEHAAAGRALERLMARIQRDRPASRSRNAAVWLRSARWQPLAAAAALVTLAAGMAWWWSENRAIAPATYTTLTTNEPGDAGTPLLRLVFATGVPEEARRAIIAELGLELAAPPAADGMYTFAVPKDADAQLIAAELRADPRVAFVTTPPAREGP
jgi:hypothetical protein